MATNVRFLDSVSIGTFQGSTSGGGGSGSAGTSGTSGVGSPGTSGTSGVGSPGSSGTSGTSAPGITSGTSGFTGTAGTSGFSGTSGVAGTSGTSGVQGPAGTSGTSAPGITSGTSGFTGTSGIDGTAGTSGLSGTSGINGSSGTSGVQGPAGTSGTSAPGITSGTSGFTGTSGIDGTAGTSGVQGPAGTAGTSGVSGAALTVTDGSTTVNNVDQITFSGATVTDNGSGDTTVTITGGGGGGTATQYNTVSRYQAYTNGSDREAWFVSSATVNTGLSWSRSTTTLTITHTSHGLNTGEAVVVRNANADNFYAIVTVSGPNTFTVTTVDSGGSSGTAAAYSKAFTVSGTPSDTALVIAAPSTGDVQLLGILYATGSRTATTLSITVPASATNGAGADNTVLNQFFPIIRVQLATTGAITGTASMTLNTSTNFNVFNLTSLSASINSLVRLTFS
jgi:hypothetical protein